MEDIFVKEFNGASILNAGIKMNISEFLVLLHKAEALSQAKKKIHEGEKNVKVKFYLGSKLYAMCNLPYKSLLDICIPIIPATYIQLKREFH